MRCVNCCAVIDASLERCPGCASFGMNDERTARCVDCGEAIFPKSLRCRDCRFAHDHEDHVLEVFRLGLALFRRAGLPWPEAEPVARQAALSVAPAKQARREWSEALLATRSAWERAFER